MDLNLPSIPFDRLGSSTKFDTSDRFSPGPIPGLGIPITRLWVLLSRLPVGSVAKRKVRGQATSTDGDVTLFFIHI